MSGIEAAVFVAVIEVIAPAAVFSVVLAVVVVCRGRRVYESRRVVVAVDIRKRNLGKISNGDVGKMTASIMKLKQAQSS